MRSADRETDQHGRLAMQMSDLVGRLYQTTGDPGTLHPWCDRLVALRKTTPPEDWRAPLYLLASGILLCHVALAAEEPSPIAESALKCLSKAKESVLPRSGIFGTASLYAANLRLWLYDNRLQPADLEAAVHDAEAAAEHNRLSPLEHHTALVTLAYALARRHAVTGRIEDLLLSIARTDEALETHGTDLVLGSHFPEAHEVRGTVTRHLYRLTGEAEVLEKSLASFQYLVEHSRGRSREVRAGSLDNYGNILMQRYMTHRDPADLLGAIDASRQALMIAPRRSAVRTRALGNLGVTLRQAHLDGVTSVEGALDEAVEVLRTAAAEAHHDPSEAPLAFARLGCMLTDRAGDDRPNPALLDEALQIFDRAGELLGKLGGIPVEYLLSQQQSIGRELADYHASALLRRAEISAPAERTRLLRRAIQLGERAKSRLLARALGRPTLAPPGVLPPDLALEEESVEGELAELDTAEFAAFGRLGKRERLHRAEHRALLRRALDDIWHQMEQYSPEAAEYVSQRRADTGAGLVVPEPEKSTAVLVSLLRAQGLAALVLLPGEHEPLVAYSHCERDPVPDALRRFVAEVPMDQGRGFREETWHRELVDLLAPLAGAVSQSAAGHSGIIVSPPQHGRELPWHVVFERSGWSDIGGEYPVPVTTLPTLAMVSTQAGGATRPRIRTINSPRDAERAVERWLAHSLKGPAAPLVVGNPTGDLGHAAEEARSIARLLGTEPLVGDSATVQRVGLLLEDAPVIHLAAHARLNADHPLDSKVFLADGFLSARDLVRSCVNAELVVLSACESGSTGSPFGEEVAGLAYALIRAGTPAVVASLWPVQDETTAWLMGEFYRERAAGSAAALARAMHRTRGRPGWEHPYFWAGFVMIGRSGTG